MLKLSLYLKYLKILYIIYSSSIFFTIWKQSTIEIYKLNISFYSIMSVLLIFQGIVLIFHGLSNKTLSTLYMIMMMTLIFRMAPLSFTVYRLLHETSSVNKPYTYVHVLNLLIGNHNRLHTCCYRVIATCQSL